MLPRGIFDDQGSVAKPDLVTAVLQFYCIRGSASCKIKWLMNFDDRKVVNENRYSRPWSDALVT
jgi:hypothetical protein